jgi:serine/threonine-protein kinase
VLKTNKRTVVPALSVPREDAVRLLLPIASGLRAAHEHGIVHRDLKPENILLAQDDAGTIQPKLLDFGIAEISSEGPSSGVFDSGAIGTVGYMPPEQAFLLGRTRSQGRHLGLLRRTV